MATFTRRVTLDTPEARPTAESVAGAFAAQLQRGLDAADADEYDAWFAADVLWGSPFGATLAGFEELNRIHHQLMTRSAAPPSQFEIVSTLAPAPGVVLTHIRRRAHAADGFSEMALYVLVERDGQWWLAAAQNTPTQAPAD